MFMNLCWRLDPFAPIPVTVWQRTAPDNEPGRTPSARRVLVVDDNEDAAESLALFLRLTGHEVRTARDGARALRAAREFRPEAVILDLAMPGLDGWEVARWLRRDRDLCGVVLVALTGYADESHRSLCLEAGFDFHLAKPADPYDVQKLVDGGRERP
jgi:CheY-like chemotaxis protein